MSAVTEAATSIFRRHHPVVPSAAGDTEWSSPLWHAMAEAGFTTVGVPVEAGGSGGDLRDVCDLLMAAGTHAAPVPLVESCLVGGWALARAGIPLPEGPVTAALPSRADGGLRVKGAVVYGTLHRVPWARHAALIVTLADDQLVAVSPDQVLIEPGRTLAGEPCDRVVVEGSAHATVVPAPPGVTHAALRRRGALGYAALISGALAGVSEITLTYAGLRRQFGQPINRFQAVARHLVRVAEETALASTAVRAAGAPAEPELVTTAIAKIVVGEAAGAVAASAHQVHGAIGMTREYGLGRLTRRLWAWRDCYGSEADWSEELGRHLIGGGADRWWSAICGEAEAGAANTGE